MAGFCLWLYTRTDRLQIAADYERKLFLIFRSPQQNRIRFVNHNFAIFHRKANALKKDWTGFWARRLEGGKRGAPYKGGSFAVD